MSTKDSEDRCWPGYEPVPGKPEHSEGSCRKKPESKTSASEKKFVATRKKQLDQWQKDHPHSPRKAAQHLPAPAQAKRSSAKKKTASAKSKSK